MTASIPPGWYEDPSSPGSERWWDGAQWTASTRARGQGEIPPPPVGTPPGGPPVGGYPQGGYPGGYQPGPQQLGVRPGRGKAIGLGVLALVVVGGIVAALLVVLGGDDGDKNVAVTGSVSDPETGITVPRLEGWVVPKSDSPAEQGFEGPCATKSSSRGTSDSGSTKSTSSSDSDEESSDDKCYRADLSIMTQKADSFDELIAELKNDVGDSKGKVKVTDTELDKAVQVDGHPAHVVRIKVRGTPEALRMNSDTAWAQVVAIDAKNADGEYPCVVIRLENSAEAPDKAVLDTVLKGIKVGTPKPSESTS
ncbi:DUF2510 domain-containing protein [Embleya sp. NBC_00896]|uniref:DUF2510 domain-containing protein n=1 Tax=Embleya sp. NBC_00896 TaxID=2975961 RepID=UPI00386FA37A|nr:DUF2510 domain-containing protein [Embleya sp. NBC_00896]